MAWGAKTRLIAAAAALVALAAPSMAAHADIPATTVTPAPRIALNTVVGQTISIGGLSRQYLLYVPSSYYAPGSVHSLALVFHGLYGTDQSLVKYVLPAASARGVMVAFPQGTANSWNAGGCCSAARASAVDDVAFARDLATSLGATYHPRSVVAAGYSNGAMLAWLLACQPDGFVQGVVDAAGDEGIDASQCTPSRPIIATAVHGLQDPNVPYNGGSPAVDSADLANPFRAIPDVLHEWGVTHEACASTKTFTAPGWSVTHWTSCAHNVTVTLYTIDGMGHDVPNYGGGEPVDFGSLIVSTAARAR